MKIYFYLLFFCISSISLAQEKTNIILDADTANEVDDLYAIIRAFAEPSWNIQALNATQWQASQWAVAETMEASHRLNLVLAGYLNEKNTRLLRGGYRRMYDWGDKAQHSAAAYNIIAQAKKQKEGTKLKVIALGALTNVASAVFIDPSISSKISVYWLGTSYDFEKKISKQTDFNPLMDLQATELLLSSDVEMHIIPVSEVDQMTSNFSNVKASLEKIHPLGDFLVQRWFNHLDYSRYDRVLWDIALIEAMLHPEWVTEIKVDTFKNKNVYLYKDIDEEKFLKDCFEKIVETLEKL